MSDINYGHDLSSFERIERNTSNKHSFMVRTNSQIQIHVCKNNTTNITFPELFSFFFFWRFETRSIFLAFGWRHLCILKLIIWSVDEPSSSLPCVEERSDDFCRPNLYIDKIISVQRWPTKCALVGRTPRYCKKKQNSSTTAEKFSVFSNSDDIARVRQSSRTQIVR